MEEYFQFINKPEDKIIGKKEKIKVIILVDSDHNSENFSLAASRIRKDGVITNYPYDAWIKIQSELEKYNKYEFEVQSTDPKTASYSKTFDLIKDIRFKTNSDRLSNQDDLDDVISKFIKKFDREPLLKKFSQAGITVGPVLDISEIIEHPYVLDREILMEHYNSEYGDILMHQAFPRLNKTPGKVINSAPSIGQNTDDVLKEIGITKQQIEKLRKNKIIS